MEFHCITTNTSGEKGQLLEDHCRVRAEIFDGWKAPNYCGGFEGDVFDIPFFNPTWVSVTLTGKTIAVGRMIPADGPCTMLEAVWPHGIQTALPPKAETVELHRIGSRPGLSKPLAMLAKLKIKHGMAKLVLESNRSFITFLTPLRVAETSLQNAKRHGPPIVVDGGQYVVVSSKIQQDGVDFLADTIEQMEAGLRIAPEPLVVF